MTPYTTTYQHAGVPLIVSVDRDADDCWVTRITAADSKIDLFNVFEAMGEHVIEEIAKAVDAKLTKEARREAAADAAWAAYQQRREEAFDRCPA